MLKSQLAKIGNGKICPVAVIIRDKNILLGMRNYTPDKWKKISVWAIPGGRSESGETIEESLRREVKEEVNITDLNIIDFIAEAPGVKEGDIVSMFYCSTIQEPKLMEPEKFSEWKWIPVKDYLAGEPYSSMNPVAHKLISQFLLKKIQ